MDREFARVMANIMRMYALGTLLLALLNLLGLYLCSRGYIYMTDEWRDMTIFIGQFLSIGSGLGGSLYEYFRFTLLRMR